MSIINIIEAGEYLNVIVLLLGLFAFLLEPSEVLFAQYFVSLL